MSNRIRRMSQLGVVVLIVLGLVLSGCGAPAAPTPAAGETPSGPPKEPVVVKATYWPGPESDAAQVQFDYFNQYRAEQAGFTVELVLFGRDQMVAKQEAIMASGSDEVDIFYISNRGLELYWKFLEPIDEYVNDPAINIWGSDKSYFIGPIVDSGVREGKWYGVPTDYSAHWIYYRTDYFDQLLNDPAWIAKYKEISAQQMGKEMTPKHPEQWDWDDFKATAFFFTQKYNPDSPTEYGTFAHGKVMGPTAFLHSNMMWDYGGDWWDAEGNITMDTEPARIALQFAADLWALGLTPESSLVGEYDEANQAFKTSSVAFNLQWNAAYPELDAPDSPVHGKFDVVAPPAGPAGRWSYSDCQSLTLNKASKHKEEAGRFLAWLCTHEANMLLGQSGGVPAAGAVMDALATERPDFPKLGRTVSQYGRNYGPSTRIYERMVCEKWANAWSGAQSVESVLTELQAAMEEEKVRRAAE